MMVSLPYRVSLEIELAGGDVKHGGQVYHGSVPPRFRRMPRNLRAEHELSDNPHAGYNSGDVKTSGWCRMTLRSLGNIWDRKSYFRADRPNGFPNACAPHQIQPI